MATSANRSLETTFYKKLPDWKLEPTCEVKGQKPIRIGLLKEWMQKKEGDSIKTNGELLFDEIQPLEGSLDSASHILESCTLVFSWLLERNRGKLIRIFHNFDVNDARLKDPQYFLDEDEDLERGLESYTSKDPAVFKKLIMHLEISRWQFCPFLLDSDLYTKDKIVPFGNKLYMPFCRQWSVAPAEAGGTADVYLAHIQEEFVAEEIRQHLGTVVIDELYEKASGETFRTRRSHHLTMCSVTNWQSRDSVLPVSTFIIKKGARSKVFAISEACCNVSVFTVSLTIRGHHERTTTYF